MGGGGGAEAIVVGGGLAGVVAALELLRAGRRVLLLDRDGAERLGGQARESFGGILVVDTPLQRRNGIRDSVALALADWRRFGRIDARDGWRYRWAEAYVGECRREVFDWLRDHGVGFLPLPQWPERSGNSVPRWHVVWGTGLVLAERLVEALQSAARVPGARLELRFGHRAERLLLSQGRVAGVAGTCEDTGEAFACHAPAVLVASGGFAGDLDEVRRHWPAAAGPPPAELLNGAHPFADGRMLRACADAGARLDNLDAMWNYAAGVRHWQARQPGHGLSLVPPRSALWLDAAGRRFDPPLLAGCDTSELVARIAAAGGASWQVMNRRVALRELAVSGAEFNPALRERRPFAFARDLLLGNRWLVDTLAARCPDVLVADSPAELAARMNALAAGAPPIDAGELERTLRAFDAARAVDGPGADPQWQNVRAARRWRGDRWRTARPGALLARGAGPLIAIRERLLSRKSLGGLGTDLDGRVLDAADRPIGGLYAAGEASGFGGGGMNGRRALEGTFLGGAIFSARRAARGMSRDLGSAPA
jgi:predicted oxidoreductase